MNDLTLFSQIQKGDWHAYKEMFLTYYSPLCEYASQFISDTDAEELVQDLMMYVWEVRENLVIGTSLKSYLFIAVKHRSYNAIRNRQYRERIHSTLYEQLRNQMDDPDFYIVDELVIKIKNAIAQLPDNYRETFEMSRFGEMSHSQIASQLNISVKTVEYRISQSLKILRIKLKDYLPFVLFLF